MKNTEARSAGIRECPHKPFEIGLYSVSKDGMLWGPDCNDLIQHLIERGFPAVK